MNAQTNGTPQDAGGTQGVFLLDPVADKAFVEGKANRIKRKPTSCLGAIAIFGLGAFGLFVLSRTVTNLGSESGSNVLNALGCGLVMVFISVGTLIAYFGAGWQASRLSARGQLLHGQVVRASKGGRGHEVLVEYRFVTPDGRQLTRKRRVTRPGFTRADLPAPGTPVRVLYISDRLQRLM